MGGELTRSVVRFLVDDDWPFAVESGGEIIRTSFQGTNGSWAVLLRIRPEQTQIAVYSTWEQRVVPDRRLPVAEYLTRANYGLVIGNFEMDLDDGEVRFKVALDLEGVDAERPTARPVAVALLHQAVYACVMSFDRYLAGLERVASGEDARRVVADVEDAATTEPGAREDDTDA
jgi:hypothetical protein